MKVVLPRIYKLRIDIQRISNICVCWSGAITKEEVVGAIYPVAIARIYTTASTLIHCHIRVSGRPGSQVYDIVAQMHPLIRIGAGHSDAAT
jgi:hypothetical protein